MKNTLLSTLLGASAVALFLPLASCSRNGSGLETETVKTEQTIKLSDSRSESMTIGFDLELPTGGVSDEALHNIRKCLFDNIFGEFSHTCHPGDSGTCTHARSCTDIGPCTRACTRTDGGTSSHTRPCTHGCPCTHANGAGACPCTDGSTSSHTRSCTHGCPCIHANGACACTRTDGGTSSHTRSCTHGCPCTHASGAGACPCTDGGTSSHTRSCTHGCPCIHANDAGDTANCCAPDVRTLISKCIAGLTLEYKQNATELLETLEDTDSELGCLNYEFFFASRFAKPFRGLQSCVVETYSYTGGAHGGTARTGLCFCLADGRRVAESELFKPGYKDTLDSLLCARLCSKAESEGFVDSLFVSDIESNGNFYITPDGVNFIYGQYEIGPYSLGIIELDLSWDVLEHILAI